MSRFRLVPAMLLGLLVESQGAWGQMVVAHRGASHDAPENTLAAFQLAWHAGSDGIEGDFYLTADRQIVCIHDKDTERTAGINHVVEQSTLAQLRQLEYGGWKGAKWKGEPIPTLREVLQTVPDGKTFVIELKSKKQIVPVLAEQLGQLDTARIRLLIISFDEATVAACKQQMPEIAVHWLTSFRESENGSQMEPTAQQIAATVQRIGAQGVGMKGNREVIDDEFIRQLAADGCRQFHVWTVDSVEDARYFQRLGAFGITTNRPGLIGTAIRSAR